ncbi:hypothetical protein SDC9_26454 [bioreactor metagenome]|uniref:Uncharacterized protein n=1 Tax=bioreactor metagenome TaxID=1076179 RepID=A0A644UPF6_9ZZZZ
MGSERKDGAEGPRRRYSRFRSAVGVRNGQRGQIAADPLLVELRIAAGADLLVHEEVQIVDQPVFVAVGEQRDIVGVEGRLADDRNPREVAGLHVRHRHGRGRDGRVDLALAQREEDVGLGLVGTELARAPFLHLLFKRDRLEGAGGGADGVALHVVERLDARLFIRGHRHLEGEVGDREAHGLRAFERVRGRGDADVNAARHQRRDPLGERRLDDLGLHAERLGEVVAIVDVEADRLVVGVAHAHRREVEHDRAAQRARGDNVVELVSLGNTGKAGRGDQCGGKGDHFHWLGTPLLILESR